MSSGPPPPLPPLPLSLRPLLGAFQAGDRRALARAISVVENGRPGAETFLHEVLKVGLRTRRVGFTGPPGAGKSTVVAGVANLGLQSGQEVGVVAVDPTSPFSGGALLGDRVRMNEVATHPGLFIRSMATRGSLGGLSTTTMEVVDLMDTFGFPQVLVETVGVGQTELEIAAATDTTVVILVPESGDGIQAMKAGLMEIADIFVVNKADRPGAARLARELRTAVHLRTREGDGGGWDIPVVTTEGRTGKGIPELVDVLETHRRHLEASGELLVRRRARAGERVRQVVERSLHRRVEEVMKESRILEGLAGIAAGRESPYSLARLIEAELPGT